MGGGSTVRKRKVKHHSSAYSYVTVRWRCCGQGDLNAQGCQEGEPWHHPKDYKTENGKKTWQCCKNERVERGNNEGCEAGPHPNPHPNHP